MSAKAKSHKAKKIIEGMGKKLNRQLVGSLVACVHCGMCTESCHYALANPDDPTFAPAYKADQIRKIFKRHFDWTGRIFPWWVKAQDIYDEEELEKLKDIVFGKCTNCRRCSINCPMGVDFAALNRMARGLLTSVGIMPEGIAVVSKDQWEIGNQMGILKEDYLETLEWLSDELENEFRDPAARIPLDKKDAEVFYAINPREIRYDPRTLFAAARIFYLAGENWTMASECWDLTNFGFFSGDDELASTMVRRLYNKVIELRSKKLVLSECGHGYRAVRCEGPNWAKMDIPFEIESSVITLLRYIREERIKVDKRKNIQPVTFHDSCNYARSCGFFEEPRELLGLVVMDFREMYPNRAENYCCSGGGGAMSMSEYTPLRLKSAKVKADQLKATGAQVVATTCHNCVDALTDLVRHYKLNMKVIQLINLVENALVVEKRIPVAIPTLTLQKTKILAVDDEPDILTFISTVLGDQGATVIQAIDADQALELALKEKPDLITLDLSLPGKNGAHVFEEIRKNPALSSAKICIITGKPELRRLIYDRPVTPPEGYLDKPINEEILLVNVRKILGLSSDGKS